ncbi:PREDICTED: PRUPE_6G029800 [Prunus dulcis]|uniref:PREDICTED: PRUPE_6G029800 n=1 Tax=Prunus dulcis TaxID=3755 RepID=A0A5E4F7V3_PRUDU|nr:PREDICTED: PRUPE_6G029800 [Prunus dulcis]
MACCVFGSKILLAGGTIGIQSPTTFRTFGSFIEGKANPFLLEVDRKLDALASYPIQSSIISGGSSYFEVIDPIRGVWLTLPYPPVFDDYNRTYDPAGPGDFFCFVARSNIFCTSAYSPSYYRFDVADPVKGWKVLPSSFNSGSLPENTLGRTFVADGGDEEFILFSFSYGEPEYPHPHILVQLLSSDFSCVATLNRVLLPTDKIPLVFLPPTVIGLSI